uniref:3-dehydro-bile acid delta(4,6)-reductase n=1 Tax=uncultured Dehalococcoidia bacterium TaxID=498747 RepID=A0A871YEF0_9CHLR|nr:3-dehydro-bile acid delta(4,6)-reductase [uncultured Dehalococcoidia bacterium]
MKLYDIAVIGGGAAGICAAISAARRGRSVVICEKTSHLGKKILATGNGRCNLLNDTLDESFYNPAAHPLVRSVFSQFGKAAVLDLFHGLGLETYSHEGRIFPRTNQAASVLQVLQMEIARLSIPVEFNFNCARIEFANQHIQLYSETTGKVNCGRVVITGGGKSYPAFGSDGSAYELARTLGHKIIEPVPSVVPLVSKDRLCQLLQGQRVFASAKSLVENQAGDEVHGELLFTKYGLSGTCILDVSEALSVAINRHKQTNVAVCVDLVPFMDIGRLTEELERRKALRWPDVDMLAGILPNKFGAALQDWFVKGNMAKIAGGLKDYRFKITGTRGWNEAEFTSGGVSVDEIDIRTLESKLKPGVYFAGEVLDVNGRRGGYNLAFAWASGMVAGQSG